MKKINLGKIEKENRIRLAVASMTFVLAIVALSLVLNLQMASAATTSINFCCERTNTGAWCQNSEQANCNQAYKISPTSCDSTSYCKRGCCFDSQEGLCMENTPQKVCQQNNGTWSENAECNIPQCQLGCCVIGTQASLVTLTRCKAIAQYYNTETDFRADITDELICIATANAQDKGACVYTDETLTKQCKFTTRLDCGATEGTISENDTLTEGETEKRFYKDILCSAPELGTVCGKTTNTMLIEGRNEVYYQDMCKNPANIYDSERYDDENYWRYVYTKAESCGAGESNAKSKTCGNCDYFLGSIGKEASGILTTKPIYGKYICADLNCEGHKHGESWCIFDEPSGSGKDSVGSRYFKQVCVDNEILIEPCSDYRNQICIQNSNNGFTEAACVANRWSDCTAQEEQKDCENLDMRDCMWIKGYYFASTASSSGSTETKGSVGVGISVIQNEGQSNEKKITPTGLCVPNYPPGFNFWGSQGSSVTSASSFNTPAPVFGAGNITSTSAYGTGATTSRASVSATDTCSMADASISITFQRTKKGTVGGTEKSDWECKGESASDQYDSAFGLKICDYFEKDQLKNPEGFAAEFNTICSAIGDCGDKANWAGKQTSDGYAVYYGGERVAGAGGSEVLEETEATTGNVVADLFKNIYEKVKS